MKKTKKKRGRIGGITDPKNMRCPNCGRPMTLRTAEGIYTTNTDSLLYVCAGYPTCDTYARVHAGTVIPMSIPASGELRALRNEAHKHFDKIHKTGIMKREDAYAWLAHVIQAPKAQAHIGYLSEYYCRVVIDESKKVLRNFSEVRSKQQLMRMGGVLDVRVS